MKNEKIIANEIQIIAEFFKINEDELRETLIIRGLNELKHNRKLINYRVSKGYEPFPSVKLKELILNVWG